jgi:hypothetical protein
VKGAGPVALIVSVAVLYDAIVCEVGWLTIVGGRLMVTLTVSEFMLPASLMTFTQ